MQVFSHVKVVIVERVSSKDVTFLSVLHQNAQAVSSILFHFSNCVEIQIALLMFPAF